MSHSINLEIIESAYVYAPCEIEELNIKTLVPKMMTRRRLTRAAKIAIYLSDKVLFDKGRIVYGSSFGELPATSHILQSISNQETISPTHFQNSVYNTAVSYLSMLHGNKEEIMTISSGDMTALNVLKMGAVKALDGDTLLLMAIETLNIDNIEKVNKCGSYLECGVALKVRLVNKEATMDLDALKREKNIPISISQIFTIAKNCHSEKTNIIEIKL